MSQSNYFANSFAWSVIAKISDAAVKFMTIPLLLRYFGKESYGILTLAIATNAYMGLLDLGINTGAVKYFSQWIVDKKTSLIDSVARTSISFYFIIGLFNALLLILLAFFGEHLFALSHNQFSLLKTMFFILAIYSVINWASSVFNQLLIANEKIGYMQQINTVKTIVQFALVIGTLWIRFSLVQYFLIYLLINSLVIIPSYIQSKKSRLIRSIMPMIDWNNFKPILIYSLSIFAMGLFQYTATQSRPLVLGMFSVTGVEILTEYRIIEVFPLFVISIGGMITSILLPKTSKMVHANDRKSIESMAYNGTALTSIIICLLTFPLIVASKPLLSIYVGVEYAYLAPWMSFWLFTLILFLNNSPIASLVLATGKTKMLVYSSAISCIISIVLNALFCSKLGVGSAVIGYFIYIVIQMSFYYLYFNPKVLQLNSLKVFTSFAIPASIGIAIAIPLYFMNINSIPLLWLAISKVLLWIVLFSSIIYIFDIASVKLEVKNFINSKKKVKAC